MCVSESLTPSTSSTNPPPSPNFPPHQSQEEQQLPIPILINHNSPNKSNTKSNNPKKNKNNSSDKSNSIPSTSSNTNIASATSSKLTNSSSNLLTAPSGRVSTDSNNSPSGVRAKIKKKLVFREDMANNYEISLKDLSHPSLNDHLKNHNAATFKLVRTGKNIASSLFLMGK